MDDSKLVQAIAEDVEALDGKVLRIAADSQRRYRLNAEPGTVMHSFAENEPADEDGRIAIAEACRDAYAEIMEDVDRHLAAASRAMSAPASADDVATVTFAIGREGITRDELQSLLDRYKGNFQLASGICERAHRAGYYLDNEPEAVRVYRDDADKRAARVLSRHNKGSFIIPAQTFADDVVGALRHIDFMGKAY